MIMKDILHTIIDVLAGRRNLTPAAADELHEQIDPGYTTPVASEEQLAAARALLAAQDQHQAYVASQAPAEPAPVFFFPCPAHLRDLHAFPTRRSSEPARPAR